MLLFSNFHIKKAISVRGTLNIPAQLWVRIGREGETRVYFDPISADKVIITVL